MLETGVYYHIFNRGVEKREIFLNPNNYLRMQTILNFYRFKEPPLRLSYFLRLLPKKQNEILKTLDDQPKLVDIFCYCLMPNHYHLLLKQLVDGGISTYLARIQNSYTRYFNVLNKRVGVLFGGKHKSVRVITDNQLLYLTFYIHLNPYSSRIVNSDSELVKYPWSSFSNYLANNPSFCNLDLLGDFRSPEIYAESVLDYKNSLREKKDLEKLLLDE